jgi:cytochrome c553
MLVTEMRNETKGALWALLLVTLGYAAPGVAQSAPDAATRRLAAGLATDTCALCHDRREGKELAPRLAGQQRDYIEAQIKAFQRQSRAEPEAGHFMSLSSSLSGDLVVALSDYFASQPPAPGIPGDPAEVAAGRQLFNRSDRASGVPSCAECHGDNAGGLGRVPRVAGQVAPYLVRQMHVIQGGLRESALMHRLIKDLSDHDLYMLAIYLQSL